MYLGLITSYAWLWKVKMCTLINVRDYKRRIYKVSDNEYGRKKKGKIQNEQLTWDLKKWNKINKRTNQRLKKKIHAERETVEKIFKKRKKKEKKEQENVVGKRKKKWKKKKTMDNTNTFYFCFCDFWVWDWHMFFVVSFCWNCIAEDIVTQFDVSRSGTIVYKNNLSSSMTNDFIVMWIGMLWNSRGISVHAFEFS